MKKLFTWVILICIVLCVLLSGCGHTHEWADASCTTPKTCKECSETEGEPLGHSWKDATCTSPKTCSRCNATEGEALGHEWTDATCTDAKTCSRCGATEGDPLGHEWVEATCTEPKTCSRCGLTEGEALGHDTTGLTCTESTSCSRCGEELSALGHDWKEATCTEPKTCSRCGETEGEALGHAPADPVKKDSVSAKCTTDGHYDSVVFCSRCRTELSRETITEKALGHTTDNGKCTRCGMEVYSPISGHGDDVVSGIQLGDGQYRLHIQYFGSSVFSVELFDKNMKGHMIKTSYGAYDGYVYLDDTPPLSFEIGAKGADWTLTIEQISRTNETEFSGDGDLVTGSVTGPSGTWEITYEGSGVFAVFLHSKTRSDFIISNYGEYSGKKIIQFPSGGACFEVTADAPWTIKPAK